jgi:AraC family transcriptional regulator of adaptative response/methylated-DNA-[protein]-cysteine methyltransferase
MIDAPALAMDEEACWEAWLARDRSFDGQFVVAVTSTGIYCRPSCPARRPRRDRVKFFEGPAMAEAAGFRACRRCHPNGEPADPKAPLVAEICRYLDAQTTPPTLEELGAQFGFSPFYLQRIFKRMMGMSPHDYLAAQRVERFKDSVKEGNKVSEAIYDAGFGSSSRLYEQATAELGMTPGAYRRGGQGMQIGYRLVDCSLGRLLVAATELGVCFVSLGDDAAVLERALHNEYPAAQIMPADEGFGEWLVAIIEQIEQGVPARDLPLDVQGTALQRQVWAALREIPPGTTTSYSELARSLGRPTAVRAVAQACARNPVAVVVPCHRVTGSDGSLRGYRWGVERKQALIEREQQ